MNDPTITQLAADVERAKHVVVRSYRQPGERYRLEVQCRCGWDGFATDHPEHRAQAVLAAAERAAVTSKTQPSTTEGDERA